MTTQEGWQDSSGGPARRRLHDTAYFLDLLGDSHNGLGRYEAAIEAYRQAAVAARATAPTARAGPEGPALAADFA
jgi:hypothetical protein